MKRLFGEEDAAEDGSFKRPRPVVGALRGVMGAQCMQNHLPKLEPFVRRVVQEEVEKALLRFLNSAPRPPINRIKAGTCRRYQLRFIHGMPNTLFTGSRVEAEGRVSVQVVITDTANSNKIVTFGSLACAKIEILVLDGDFCGDHHGEWTEKEFGNSLVREREGRRPLLTGDLVLTLCNGVGFLGDITFTDNSSWIRSRKFRLGARLHQSRCTEVQEAISEAFLVKDHRGELYKKHHPPSLNDDVWRLERIGKDGVFHKRLADHGIRTVQDFLKNLIMDQERLRNILGNGMLNKMWEATVVHAKECVLDEKMYSYCRGQDVLLFNSIFELVGAMFDSKFHFLDELTAPQKVLVNKLKVIAYKNPDDIIELNIGMIDMLQRRPSLAISEITSVCETRSVSQFPEPHLEVTLARRSELTDLFQPRENFTGLDFHTGPSHGPLQLNSFNMRDFLDTPYQSPILNADHIMGYHSGIDSSCSSPNVTLWDHENQLVSTSNAEYSNRFTRRASSSRKWIKILAALKWMTLARRRASRRARNVNTSHSFLTSNSFM